MLIYALFGLNVVILLMTLTLLIKQWLAKRDLTQDTAQVADKLTAMAKQHQYAEQQLRESLLLNMSQLQQQLIERLGSSRLEQSQHSADLKEQLQQAFANHRMRFDERQMDALKVLQDTLHKGTQDNRQQLKEALADSAKELSARVEQLTLKTEGKLKEINQQVEKRLSDGFEKTNDTFNNVIKRLALIDAAQQKITELSTNVVSLQEILNDKRSRGAFGEVQLSALIRNMIPEQHFSFQHVLSNQKRVDCMLFLPEPSGNIAIDAKFPLENYKLLSDGSLPESERVQAERQFKLDIRKHINDIAEKYIIAGETSDGAVMFIPAEAIFAEIHAKHPDLVTIAQQAKIWIVSPTTMMAVLTTVRSVLKDAATKKQIHEIQKHLRMLANDFDRFQTRMDSLAKNIAKAHSEVEQVHISSKKISSRFVQIEKAELDAVEVIEETSL